VLACLSGPPPRRGGGCCSIYSGPAAEARAYPGSNLGRCWLRYVTGYRSLFGRHGPAFGAARRHRGLQLSHTARQAPNVLRYTGTRVRGSSGCKGKRPPRRPEQIVGKILQKYSRNCLNRPERLPPVWTLEVRALCPGAGGLALDHFGNHSGKAVGRGEICRDIDTPATVCIRSPPGCPDCAPRNATDWIGSRSGLQRAHVSAARTFSDSRWRF